LQSSGHRAEFITAGATAALLAGETPAIAAVAARHGLRAILRPGLAVYGLAPEFDPPFAGPEPAPLIAARQRLQPVLSWKTRITCLRSIPPGDVVGYNGTFVASEPMQIALLPVGYADGLDRKLGNHLSVLVAGQRAPIIGRISMDLTAIDVTGIPGVAVGDEAVLIGRQGEEEITATDHARACGTIPWEILTRISSRVPRLRQSEESVAQMPIR
jgi:alanine racemase